jgi:hypothetical protein
MNPTGLATRITNFLELPQAIQIIDPFVGPPARLLSTMVFDVAYRLGRLPFSFIASTDAIGKKWGIEKLSAGAPYISHASNLKNFLSVLRVAECYTTFKDDFLNAGFKINPNQHNDAEYDPSELLAFEKADLRGQVAVRRISWMAGTFSALCETADYIGMQKYEVVASILNSTAQIPIIGFGLSTFSRGDNTFKLVSLSFSMLSDIMNVYYRSVDNETKMWKEASTDEIRKFFIDKLGKIILISLGGNLFPELNSSRDFKYCTLGFIVDCSGVYGVHRKYQKFSSQLEDSIPQPDAGLLEQISGQAQIDSEEARQRRLRRTNHANQNGQNSVPTPQDSINHELSTSRPSLRPTESPRPTPPPHPPGTYTPPPLRSVSSRSSSPVNTTAETPTVPPSAKPPSVRRRAHEIDEKVGDPENKAKGQPNGHKRSQSAQVPNHGKQQ